MALILLSESIGISPLALISLTINIILVLVIVIMIAMSLTRRHKQKHAKIEDVAIERRKNGNVEIVKRPDGTIIETHKSRRTNWYYRLVKSAEGITIRYEDSNGNVLTYTK